MSKARAPRTRQRKRSSSGLPLVVGVVVLLAAIGVGVLLLRQEPAQQTASGPAASLPSSGHTLGNASAPVTVDEWGDFQ